MAAGLVGAPFCRQDLWLFRQCLARRLGRRVHLHRRSRRSAHLPALDANGLPVEGLAPSRLSYFNLHGVEDGPEWYGQRTLDDPATLPEYPVALRPADVANSGRAPVFVFSEACYGANIAGKQVGEALCLKFLHSGTRAMVASTKIAYGSVDAPLIGADLLGRCFWQNINQGLPAGEALRRAKLQMAQDMTQRQGFLDGEDQKTLISFVLYGDPLAVAPAARGLTRHTGKPLSLPKLRRPVTVCDKATGKPESTPAPARPVGREVAQIKSRCGPLPARHAGRRNARGRHPSGLCGNRPRLPHRPALAAAEGRRAAGGHAGRRRCPRPSA